MPESLFQKVAGLRITSSLKRGSSTAGFFAFQNIYGRLLLYGELINLRHRFLVCLSSILTIFCLTGFQYPRFQYILVCSDAAFKARLFSSDFSLPVKMVELPQQHVNTTVPWLQTLPLPILANSSILNVAGICL